MEDFDLLYLGRRYIEACVDDEINEYGWEFEIEDIEIHNKVDGIVSATVSIKNTSDTLYVQVTDMKPLSSTKNPETTDCKFFVEIGEDSYYETRSYDHTAKYFWIALLSP